MGDRQFTRVGFRIFATVTSDGAVCEGEVDNISLHGIFIKGVQVDVGRSVAIKIRLNSTQPEILIRVDATAVRSAEAGTAFEFTKVDVDSFIHLRKIVSYATSDGDAVMGEFVSYVDQKLQEQGAENN